MPSTIFKVCNKVIIKFFEVIIRPIVNIEESNRNQIVKDGFNKTLLIFNKIR